MQFGKRSENVKGKLCLKVNIAIFPSLTIVLSLRDIANQHFEYTEIGGHGPLLRRHCITSPPTLLSLAQTFHV